ncbi:MULTISPECIES: iron-containing redox enzyme family protein [unclassified Pseudomonas]|uniref:iron-containing redox enzyme family protein n=1 Tax=unclassified Pseudomonas TaxID=196821 RepID=UPI00118383E7|nr:MULTISPECIES: iron-containing redox enzyme family protein [unclassified Pseudomonas]
MTVMNRNTARAAQMVTESTSLRQRYQAMLAGQDAGSGSWLEEQLAGAASMPDDLPDTPSELPAWSKKHTAEVATAYTDYRAQRRQGMPRRYFSNRAHALWFLQQVAPTKAVDGAWLQGTLHHWRDPRYHGLIRTYLEELGNGDPRCNHVLIYQRLLGRLGCVEAMPLDDTRYLQGALQLALGQHCDTYLPEVVGYNLGYEQPPLHLLITTYELAELGIDGQYFQLHVTIDNAASGHARLAIQALNQLSPAHDPQAFYAKARIGYRLNNRGVATPDLIRQFDLQGELFAALERKRVFGQMMHADHCRLQQRTVNQWLAEPGAMPAFVAALQAQGWIRRGQPPANSRWWTLIDGPTAAMFGVFNAYEKQLWHDWIADDWQPSIRRVSPGSWGLPEEPEDIPNDALNVAPKALIQRMAGNRHATPDGLCATRAYMRVTGLRQEEPR